jgi:hypothetical protein
MNGRTFSVAETRRVIDSVLSLDDPKAFKDAMPWQTKPAAGISSSKLARSGQSLPPFHGRCRCTLITVSEGNVLNRLDYAFEHLDEYDRAYIVDAFKKAPKEVVKQLEKYGADFKGLERPDIPRTHAQAYFNPSTNKIVIAKNYSGDITGTMQHEMGHYIDRAIAQKSGEGGWFSRSGDIEAAIDKDRKLLAGKGAAKQAFKGDMRFAMMGGQKYSDNPPVSDIFCSMSKGEISGGWGHSKAYYRKVRGYERLEVFANLFQLKSSGNDKAIEFVRGFFPDTVEAFEKWLNAV